MIKITTDSTCDLPRELLERYNITVTPLGIIKAGKLYQDGVDIRTGDIAAHVDAGGEITTTNAVCADIGASTGGFTDCMLQNGAEKVYAVDVGYGQLAWKLRSDPRVVCLERTNARYLTHEQVPDALDFASVDVSFISLKLILPPLNGLLKDGGHAACLVKPQFEAGREKVLLHISLP